MTSTSNHRHISDSQTHDNHNATSCHTTKTDQRAIIDVGKNMVRKITDSADEIVTALIEKAKTGHYQAAQYLLSEMHRLGAELKDADEPTLLELFQPMLERLNAKYGNPARDLDDEPNADDNPVAKPEHLPHSNNTATM